MLVNGKPIAELELGQRVSCVVNKIGGNGGCSVFVSNYVQGLVDVYHCPSKLNSWLHNIVKIHVYSYLHY